MRPTGPQGLIRRRFRMRARAGRAASAPGAIARISRRIDISALFNVARGRARMVNETLTARIDAVPVFSGSAGAGASRFAAEMSARMTILVGLIALRAAAQPPPRAPARSPVSRRSSTATPRPATSTRACTAASSPSSRLSRRVCGRPRCRREPRARGDQVAARVSLSGWLKFFRNSSAGYCHHVLLSASPPSPRAPAGIRICDRTRARPAAAPRC